MDAEHNKATGSRSLIDYFPIMSPFQSRASFSLLITSFAGIFFPDFVTKVKVES